MKGSEMIGQFRSIAVFEKQCSDDEIRVILRTIWKPTIVEHWHEHKTIPTFAYKTIEFFILLLLLLLL